jgi:recombination protein RecT
MEAKMTEQTSIQKVSNYLHSDEVKLRFADVVGDRNAGAYISSVLLAVASSKDLQKCTIASIYISGMRAASLRLSVDPGAKQAYMVPFKDTATLIVGYKGLYDMAVRTGKYRYINVGAVYEGQTITPDAISGLITHKSIGGSIKSKVIIGWLGAFEMRDGFAHTLYMTREECQAHGKKYSKSYDYGSSLWKSEPEKMEQKTVLRMLLSHWGYLDPVDMMNLTVMDENPPEIVDAVMSKESETSSKSEAELMRELGYDAPDEEEPEVMA